MKIDLTGKTAVVTGGSRGIGRAVCLMLARSGAAVVFGYLADHQSARTLEGEIASLGGSALGISGDVRRKETYEELFDRARAGFGPVEIAVGNAGIWKRAPIDEMSEDQWQEMVAVNLTSIYLLCSRAAREMKSSGLGGRIVLIGSTAGQRGEAFHSHYAATKGAIHALTKSLGAELGSEGIRVNCAAPGWVETDMTADCFANPNFREALEKSIPLGRAAKPEEIAGAVLFLASDLASHLQGEILNVNGGSVLCG